MIMSSKVLKSISKLNLNSKQLLTKDQCTNVKGKGYYCCIRNRWM